MKDEELGYFEPRPWHREQSAASESVGERSVRIKSLGPGTAGRDDEVMRACEETALRAEYLPPPCGEGLGVGVAAIAF